MKSPLAAQMELTKACNFACMHCYNYWRYLQNNSEFEKDDFSRGLEGFKIMLQALIDKEVPSITFTGGEPFIRRDILYPLVTMAKDSGMRVRVNTNGALITEEDVKGMAECGVDAVLISFPSNIREEYIKITNCDGYDSALKAIDLISKTNISLQINMVVSTVNINSVVDNGLFLKDKGVLIFSGTPAVSCPCAHGHKEISLDPVQVKKVLDDLLFLQEKGMKVDVLEPLTHCMFTKQERIKYAQFFAYRSCSAGISDVALSPDGGVRACILSNSVEANIFSDGWEESWRKLEKWTGAEMLPRECLECEAVDFCGGGCRIAALAKNGDICGKDPYMQEKLSETELPFVPFDDSEIEIQFDAQLSFVPNLKARKEDFGGIILCDNMKHQFLYPQAFEFLKNLLENEDQVFSIEGVAAKYAVDKDDLRKFFTHLLRNKFIAKWESKRRR